MKINKRTTKKADKKTTNIINDALKKLIKFKEKR